MELPDYWLSRPGVEPGPDKRASFDRMWDRAIASGGRPLVEVDPALRWQFLCHLADARGFVLHGSGDPGIDVFEPRQAIDLSAFGNQRAVYAACDGIWAMFFAIRPGSGPIGHQCLRSSGRRRGERQSAAVRVFDQPIGVAQPTVAIGHGVRPAR